MTDTFAETIDEEVRPLMTGYVLNASIVTELDDAADLAEVFAVLQFLEQKIDARKKVIRARLLHKAENSGKRTDMGGQYIRTEFGEITRERRVSKMPEEDVIKELLVERGMEFREVFSEQKKMVLDPSKIGALIERGKLPRDAIEKARKVTWALKFRPNRVVAEKMDAMIPGADE